MKLVRTVRHTLPRELPIPSFYDRSSTSQVYAVDYLTRARDAGYWRQRHGVTKAVEDEVKVCLLLVDLQLTFCNPTFELYAAGPSGRGATDDVGNICEFIYRNLNLIHSIVVTLDTHELMQIFHPIFWVNAKGEQPAPGTEITAAEIEERVWRVNPLVIEYFQAQEAYDRDLNDYVLFYARELERRGRYKLIIWPYHALVGSLGHALVPAVNEAVFFHSTCRMTEPVFEIKGDNPFTEYYSALSPEVSESLVGETPMQSNLKDLLVSFDGLIIAGEAKSHCLNWTVKDLLEYSAATDPSLPSRLYLLADGTSPVVLPDGPDFTDAADAAFRSFAEKGVHVVESKEPVRSWPGMAEIFQR